MQKEDFKISNYILASKQKRFLNWIVDSIIMLVVFRLIMALISSSVILNAINSLDRIERYLFWSVVSFVYYGITESFLSRSPAKYFTKTMVVMEDGTKPNAITILARTTLRILPLEPFSFLRGRVLGLHDKNSRTFVVVKSKFEQQLQEYLELVSLEKVLK